MPPKKKPGEEEEPLEEEKDLLEKELVISYLKSKLASYQEQHDSLRVENYKLTEELEDQKSKLKDINEFLVNELKARALSFAALQAELTETKKTMEENQANFQSELKRIKEESDRVIADLEERMADSDRKARSAEEYLGMREELLQEKASLQEQMQDMRNQFELQISEIERQHVQDRDKWKKTMAKRIQETKQYMIQLTDNQLELTTKRTIMENEQMSAEMAYQSHQTSSVLAQNLSLEKRMAQLRRELTLSRDTQNELSKRNLVYQRAIKNLLVWLREQDGKEVARVTEAASSDALLTELQQELRRQELLADHRDADLAELRSKLAEKDAEAAERARTVKDTSSFLLACMEDVKSKIVEVDTEAQQRKGDNSLSLLPGQLKDLSQSQRERVLAFLMEKLQILEGPDSELLGLVRPTSTDIALPPMKAPVSKCLNNPGAPGSNPVAATMSPEEAGTTQKVPITPPPTMISPYWGTTTGQVLHTTGQGEGSYAAFPPCMLSASTQTCDQEMESADRLLNKVMHDVRPWGRKAKGHPVVVKTGAAKKSPQVQRPVNTSRRSLATPTGPLPRNCADVTKCQTPQLSDLDPAIASAALNTGKPPQANATPTSELPPPAPGGMRSSSCASVSRGGMGTRGSRGTISSRGTAGHLPSSIGSMTDVSQDKVAEIQERGKAALTSHFKPGSPTVDM